jgi:thioredoxin 2
VPAKHIASQGRCGACKAALPPLAEPLNVDEATFLDIEQHARVPVLVDFWAPWCGPCRMVAPELERLARDVAGRALVVKVDTDRYPGLAARFKVSGIPNFVVLREGRLVEQRAGAMGYGQLRGLLERAG